jgi:hypothetical protein
LKSAGQQQTITRERILRAQLVLADIISRRDAATVVRLKPLWDRFEAELAAFDDNDIRARARRLIADHGEALSALR